MLKKHLMSVFCHAQSIAKIYSNSGEETIYYLPPRVVSDYLPLLVTIYTFILDKETNYSMLAAFISQAKFSNFFFSLPKQFLTVVFIKSLEIRLP